MRRNFLIFLVRIGGNMSVIQGILLGILQGVAEFLPISSSGHLLVAQKIFGLEEVPLLFDIFLHMATLLAVVIYFRKKIWNLLKILGRWIARKPCPENTENSDDLLCGTDVAGRKTIIAIIITTAITGVIGYFMSKKIDGASIKLTCAGFLITAFLLILSSVAANKKRLPGKSGFFARFSKKETELTSENSEISENNENQKKLPAGISILQSVIIGIMQGFGTLPGISRSGSTIAGALYSGVDKSVAGDYSFLVSIPAILGAFILELKDLEQVKESVGVAAVIAGCAAAFATGYISLTFLMKILRKGKLHLFAIYLIPLGIFGLFFFK